jgi:GAF domain-containing protein
MPAHPTREQVQIEYERIWQNLGQRSIESLDALPLMTHPDMQSAMGVLSLIPAPAFSTDINLLYLVFCQMVNTSLEYGTTGASAHGYAELATILGPVFHRYHDGYRFGELACNLVEKYGFDAYKAKAFFCMQRAMLWTQPINSAIDFIRLAIAAGIETHDLPYACFSYCHLVTGLILQGVHLDEVWRESEESLDFIRKVRFRDSTGIVISQQRFVLNMRGETAAFSSFSDTQFSEEAFEAEFVPDKMAHLPCHYWILKLQARFISGDYNVAIRAAQKAKALLWSADQHIQSVDYHYYGALTAAALYETAGATMRSEALETIEQSLTWLREWAESCPGTFLDKYTLVLAELARIEGRELDSMRLYEEAIRAARDHSFVQNEGIANELAAKFYLERRYETIAHTYLRKARHCYLSWGALGKVRQIDQAYPKLHEEEMPSSPTSTGGMPSDRLDLATIIKALQAVSSEIVFSKLIETLMRTTVEHAGAERGWIILLQNNEPQIEAQATTWHDQVDVAVHQARFTNAELPQSLIQYVLRTRERVILQDASIQNLFSEDDYLRRRCPKSVLCLPIVKQAELVGALYLENKLTSDAFTADSVTVLELLTSQAAVSLENARLYADLQQENSERKRVEQAVRASEKELNKLNRTLRTLYECNRAVIHATDEIELFQSVCRILVEVGGLRFAWVGRCENDIEESIRPLAKAGHGVDYLEKVKISWSEQNAVGRGPAAHALRTGKPYWIRDTRAEDPFLGPWRTEAIARGFVSCVALPLIVNDKRLGNLSLYAAEPNAFNESTIEQYTDLANNLAFGVMALRTGGERSRAEEKIREHAVKLSQANEVLKRSLNALARDQRFHSLIDQVLVVLTEQLGGHSSTLWRIDVEKRRGALQSVCRDGQVAAAQDSDHPNAFEPQEWSSDDPVWIALQMKRPFLHNADTSSPQAWWTPSQKTYFSVLGIQSLVAIPLVFGEELIGMLSVRVAANRQFDEETLEFAQALAQQATLALELERLAEQSKQTALVVEREQAARERSAELAKANEALRECLDALASVPELDEFLGQVMAAIARQLGAASSVLRWSNQEQTSLTLDMVFQDGRVMTPTEARYPERFRSIPLDERQLNMMKRPATILHLLDESTGIPAPHRDYLIGLGLRTVLVVPLVSARKLLGSLTLRFTDNRDFRGEEIEITRALATQASLAIQLTRLANTARQSAVLEERNKLAGEIHDTLAQFFTGISMQLGAAAEVMKAGSTNILSYLERGLELAQFGLAEARRSAFSLQPTILEESGLIEALRKLAERSNIPGRMRCNFHSSGVVEDCLQPFAQLELLRIAQEALSNAVRHAKPTVISVNLRSNPPKIVLEISDNGSGIADSRLANGEGFGLASIRSRAEHIGADLEIRTAVGRGTTVLVTVPMNF